jgi:hypothetical protein
VVDQPSKLQLPIVVVVVVVAVASPAGPVQFVAVALGAALQYMCLVAVLELLWLRGQPRSLLLHSPSRHLDDADQQHHPPAARASGEVCTHTGVRPKKICGALPLLTLSRSSSTMSWVISTCMACSGGETASLDSKSWSGAPTRVMPPVGSSAVAMMGLWSIVSMRSGSRCEARTRMLSREAMHGESTQALERRASSADGYDAEGPSLRLLAAGV